MENKGILDDIKKRFRDTTYLQLKYVLQGDFKPSLEFINKRAKRKGNDITDIIYEKNDIEKIYKEYYSQLTPAQQKAVDVYLDNLETIIKEESMLVKFKGLSKKTKEDLKNDYSKLTIPPEEESTTATAAPTTTAGPATTTTAVPDDIKGIVDIKPIQPSTTETKQSTQRTGKLGPHDVNDTKKITNAIFKKSEEEQIREISNWTLFDLPSGYYGTGNKFDNPWVKQDIDHQQFLFGDATLWMDWESYLLTDGVNERKNFYMDHPLLQQKQINQVYQEKLWDNQKYSFYDSYNTESKYNTNLFFPVINTPEELNDFKNIYPGNPGYAGNTPYNQFQNIDNLSVIDTNDTWLNNNNIFVNP
jgi:hypothetical protein